MNTTNFEQALMRMGYRQPDAIRDPNRWVKPVGYGVFIAHAKELRINSHFMGANKVLLCWNGDTLSANKGYPFEAQIATFEHYNGNNGPHDPIHFGFLTKEQRAESTLKA